MLLSAVVIYWHIDTVYRHNLLEHPNSRSLHQTPIAVGGGWPIVVFSLGAWIIWHGPLVSQNVVILICALWLAILSWIDDLSPVSPLTRFIVQIAVVAVCLTTIPPDIRVFSENWPVLFDRLLTGLCWVWFVNLFNFMDGIDGLAGTEAIFIAAGFFMIGFMVDLSEELTFLALLLAASTCGFLIWNWHPAKIILGDVGSIPLGFILGWLLIHLAVKGYIFAAFILPLYFLVDATGTLLLRMFRGERFWQPHRQHLYQRAALAGFTHAEIVLRIILANCLLMLCALYALYHPVIAFCSAVLIVIGLVANLYVIGRSLRVANTDNRRSGVRR